MAERKLGFRTIYTLILRYRFFVGRVAILNPACGAIFCTVGQGPRLRPSLQQHRVTKREKTVTFRLGDLIGMQSIFFSSKCTNKHQQS